MDWLKVKIFTTSQGCEIISSALYAMGIYGLEIFDPMDYVKPQKDYTWDYIDDDVIKKQNEEAYICAYVGDTPIGYEQVNAIRSNMSYLKQIIPHTNLGRLEITVDDIKDEDWLNNWKVFFRPMEIGENFIVTPEWEINSVKNKTDKKILTMNPGGIFGTGSHETTQLCIEEIERVSKEFTNKNNMLDIGCGSGILSIASILLEFKNVYCVDIDPNALTIVPENMRMNNIDENKYQVICGNILADDELIPNDAEFEIIAANIMADIIIEMLPKIKNKMSKKTYLILSGIITDRLDDVKNAININGYTLINEKILNDWCSITAKII